MLPILSHACILAVSWQVKTLRGGGGNSVNIVRGAMVSPTTGGGVPADSADILHINNRVVHAYLVRADLQARMLLSCNGVAISAPHCQCVYQADSYATPDYLCSRRNLGTYLPLMVFVQTI